MKKNLILSLLAACFLAAGCAIESNTASEPVAEKEYTTGSNIPRKSGSSQPGVSTVTRESMDRLPATPPPASPAASGR